MRAHSVGCVLAAVSLALWGRGAGGIVGGLGQRRGRYSPAYQLSFCFRSVTRLIGPSTSFRLVALQRCGYKSQPPIEVLSSLEPILLAYVFNCWMIWLILVLFHVWIDLLLPLVIADYCFIYGDGFFPLVYEFPSLLIIFFLTFITSCSDS